MKIKWMVIVPLLLGTVFTCVPDVAWGVPTISLVPRSGPPGTKVAVSGSGFAPGDASCVIVISSLVSNPQCTVSGAGSGEVVGAFTVASGAALDTEYTVEVVGYAGGDIATSTFHVMTWSYSWIRLTGATPDGPGMFMRYSTYTRDWYMDILVRGMSNGIHQSTVTISSRSQSSWLTVGGSTNSTPAIFGDWNLYMVRGTDNGIYWKFVADASWHKLSGSTPSGPAMTVFRDYTNPGTNWMYVVVRGGDNGIWWSRVNMNTYVQESWHKLTGATSDSPSVVIDGSYYMYIAVRGLSDNGIYWCKVDLLSATFDQSLWYRVGGSTLSGPAIAFTRWLTIAVRGGDNRIYFQNVGISDNNQPGWNVLSGSTPSRPAMAYVSSQGLLYFCVRGTDNRIYWMST